MLADFRLQQMLPAILYDRGAHFTAAFKDTHNGSLILAARPGDPPLSLANMHVAGVAADESLVRFHFASKQTKAAILEGEPQAVGHEPRRLLGHAQIAGQFA